MSKRFAPGVITGVRHCIPQRRLCRKRNIFRISPLSYKGGRGDFDSPILYKPLKSPSIPFYYRQLAQPCDVRKGFPVDP